ncbi:hypothetical protein AK830_g3857 [Neonectria ditissima]|uniref:Zn(2)-C6 fungal-type domain-containing protein n=1 Tax=Neonectria ditissima TaxID=78410 RepID=A0A0P7BAQ6_9HYPO|nr:hypothetical protein AK830_g3857 [Neonectria ditissima]
MSQSFQPGPIPPESYSACQGVDDPSHGSSAESGNAFPAVSSTRSRAGRRTGEERGASPVSGDSPQTTSRKRPRPESSRADVAYPRKRAIAACRLCRSRKVKCNNARPCCGNCEASKAVCVYEDTQDISSSSPCSFDPASLLILDKLNQVLSRLDRAHIPVGHASIPGQVGGPETPSPRISVTETNPLSVQAIPANGVDTQDQDLDGESDQLHIPSSRTNVDSVLQWPIFGGRFPPSYISDTVFELGYSDEAPNLDQCFKKSLGLKTSSIGVDEEDIMNLVQRFLDLVHIKNPILDIRTLWSYARNVLEDGLKWDSASCLVLITCALGCVATPFPPKPIDANTHPTSLEAQLQDLQQGEAYYNLARRRFGVLEIGILSSQCHFLAGVYNMYLMRPLPAWCQFQSASRSYYLYLQCQARQPPQPILDSVETSKSRSYEQRLYWSCYKTECELRAEISLPNSSLADVHYSHMHPSPPDMDDDEASPPFGSSPQDRPWSRTGVRTASGSRQQHQQTWYYYLTEITLRRIANRVLNMFYAGDYTTWTKGSVPIMVKAAEEFEQQLETWHAGLPPLIQFSDEIPPSEELPYHVRGRVLEIKTWIYAPFLYYAIHSQHDALYSSMIQPFVEKAVSHSFCMIRDEPSRHRHHGSWFGVRSITASCLFILGAVRSRTISVPEQWRQEVSQAIHRMRYWAVEGPGISRAIEVLEAYINDV